MARVKPPLRIGIPPMLSTVFFPELLTAFRREHPEIAVVLEEYGSVRACNLVQDDTLDLALVNMEQYNIDKFHNINPFCITCIRYVKPTMNLL